MSIDLDKLADEVAGAVLDVIEEERRINRSDISAAIKKTLAGKVTPGYGGMGIGTFMSLGDGVHVYREYGPITETVVHIALNEKSRKWSDVDPPLLPVTVEICGQPGVTCTVTPDRLVMRAADGTILMEHGFDDLGNPCPIKPVDPPLLPDED